MNLVSALLSMTTVLCMENDIAKPHSQKLSYAAVVKKHKTPQKNDFTNAFKRYIQLCNAQARKIDPKLIP